jgi:hypothetical protein
MSKITVIALSALGAGLIPGTQELSINLHDYRSLSQAAAQLRLKTGWQIALEEPLWPPRAADPRALNLTTAKGNRVIPPNPDHLVLPALSLLKTSASAAAGALLAAWNRQNPAVCYKRTVYRDVVVLEPDSLVDASGKRSSARSILSAQVQIPAAARTPEDHLEALAQAIGKKMRVAVTVQTAAFGSGFNMAFVGEEKTKPIWGTGAPASGRAALLDFLQGSRTKAIWEVDCQVGVAPSSGECILSVMPLAPAP